MKVKLTDQLHISEISSDTIAADTVIDVTDETGESLVSRGLATKVGGAKVAPAPNNKKAAEPKNKAAKAPIAARPAAPKPRG